MAYAFLSYSRQNKDFVKPIAKMIRRHCYFDVFSFEAGEKILSEIFGCLKETDVFVYFISDGALNSKWVKEELSKAEELLSSKKLKQIFPIIIDPNVNHEDPRIASFLRRDYNLQHIDNPKVVARKIIQQLAKTEFENDLATFESRECFYGRDDELKDFKLKYDDIFSEKSMKSIIVSGIPGIGKKSFIKKALTETGIIQKYHQPIVIPVQKYSHIEDIIILLSEEGYGNYSIKQITEITSLDEKIEILTELIDTIHRYKEIVIFEDDECLVNSSGTIAYWFHKAIERSESGIATVITTNVSVERNEKRKYQEYFFMNLNELSRSESAGAFRVYSELYGITLTKSNIKEIIDIINGYPPQIKYCVEMIKDEGFDYVKEHTNLIVEPYAKISAEILDGVSKSFNTEEFYGLLSLIAKIDTIPMSLLNKIYKLNPRYRDIILTLRKYSICYTVGSSNEKMTMNSVIQDYISRQEMKIPKELHDFMEDELKRFNMRFNQTSDEELTSISELKYFLKENLKRGLEFNSAFLYSALVIQSIIELYNEKEYSRVISITKEITSAERYSYFDESVKSTIQYYYCQSLIQIHSTEFESQVSYFADTERWSDYHYLKGFYYRTKEIYAKAEEELLKVLKINPNHNSARIQLVRVYMSTQRFEESKELAKRIYRMKRDNPHHLQAYYECITECSGISPDEKKDLEEMLQTIKRIHRNNPTSFYYQIMAENEMHQNKNYKEALKYLDEGLKAFPNNMYILRVKFDICCYNRDIKMMTSSLSELSAAVKHLDYKGIYHRRKAILDLMSGKNKSSVRL